MGLSEPAVSLGKELKRRPGSWRGRGQGEACRNHGKNWDKVEQTQLKMKIANDLVGLTNEKTVLKDISNILERYEIL